MKPKARYDPVFKVWILWDGISFKNGSYISSDLTDAFLRWLNNQKPNSFAVLTMPRFKIVNGNYHETK